MVLPQASKWAQILSWTTAAWPFVVVAVCLTRPSDRFYDRRAASLDAVMQEESKQILEVQFHYHSIGVPQLLHFHADLRHARSTPYMPSPESFTIRDSSRFLI